MSTTMNELIVAKTAIALIAGLITSAKGSLDIHKQIKGLIPAEGKRILMDLQCDERERPRFSWGKGAPPIGAVYDALDLARPSAETLLKRLRDHALLLGMALSIAWCLLTGMLLVTLNNSGASLWVTLASALLAAGIGYVPSRFVGLQKYVQLAERAQVISQFRAVTTDTVVRVAKGIRALAWNPLSGPEQEFLEAYASTRSLVSSLEAQVLTTLMDEVRAPLFAGYKGKLQELVSSALEALVRDNCLTKDTSGQKPILEKELRRLGLGDLILTKSKGATVIASEFWFTDFTAAKQQKIPFGDIVGAYLGIGSYNTDILTLQSVVCRASQSNGANAEVAPSRSEADGGTRPPN
jgi:hypothetical protein